MTIQDILSAILSLVAGIGVFLVACKMMSTGMENLSGDRLKAMFKKVSGNPFLGVGIGAFATAIIQSSGATTVMVLGFVNARIMSMFQAVTLIYGASIGTTITGQIVALGMFGKNTISTTVIFSAFAGIGAFIALFAKKGRSQDMGSMLAGFGMLFVGLALMSSSMSTFAQDESVKGLLESIQNPILLIIIATILTAIINSSSVMTSIAITMVFAGLISLDQGIYLALGANIGACITGLMASLTGSVEAKRCAIINVIYKVIGVILFVIVANIMKVASGGTLSYGVLFERMFPNVPQTQLAMFHTFFNCIIVLISLPFTNMFIRWSQKLIPYKVKLEGEGKEGPKLYYINDNMLRTPTVAIEQLKQEVINMAQISIENFKLACNIVCTLNYDEVETFRDNEVELNYLNKEIVRFVVKLSQAKLNEKDRLYLSTVIKSASDLERVGDYAENIVEYADSLNSKDRFSPEAVNEINYVKDKIEELYDKTMFAYINNDVSLMDEINEIEDIIDDKTKEMELKHIERLGEGICTANVGAQYLSIATNIERIGDHYVNVSKAVTNSNMY